MIQRKDYLNLLKKWKDENVIKVITGIQYIDYGGR